MLKNILFLGIPILFFLRPSNLKQLLLQFLIRYMTAKICLVHTVKLWEVISRDTICRKKSPALNKILVLCHYHMTKDYSVIEQERKIRDCHCQGCAYFFNIFSPVEFDWCHKSTKIFVYLICSIALHYRMLHSVFFTWPVLVIHPWSGK